MKIQIAALLLGISSIAHSQTIRANITGGDGDGKCTFEVEVDGAADIEIRGDRGSIRQLSGQTARWRRLTCNQPLPNNPGNFRFRGIDGRGQQQLVRDPNSSGGVAVIRITDPKGGAEAYTGDIEWRGGNDNYGGNGNWNMGRNPNGNWNSSINGNDALRICRDQVIQTRNVQGNRVTVSRGQQQADGDSIINFTFRNANNVTKRGFCNVSATGQIVEFQMEGNNNNNNNRASWNQALNTCQEEVGRRLGVSSESVRVQHGLDPGNGNYLVNYQAQDRSNRIRTGSCRVSPNGEIEDFRRQ